MEEAFVFTVNDEQYCQGVGIEKCLGERCRTDRDNPSFGETAGAEGRVGLRQIQSSFSLLVPPQFQFCNQKQPEIWSE